MRKRKGKRTGLGRERKRPGARSSKPPRPGGGVSEPVVTVTVEVKCWIPAALAWLI